MKRLVLVILVAVILLTACGGESPLEERIIGKWSGAMTNISGNKIPATWEFIEGGIMVVTIEGVDISYGAEWSVDGNRINFTTEINPDRPTYRDIEFVSDDVMRASKDDFTETWSRTEE